VIHKLWRFLKELYRRYDADQCSLGAAAISFFVLIAFVPMLLCAVAALGYVIDDSQNAALQTQQFILGLIPGVNATEAVKRLIVEAEIEKRAAEVIALRGWGWLIGIVTLLWAASRIFANATPPMNAAFNAPETRNFFQRQVYAIGMLFAAGSLFLLSLVLTAFPALLFRLPALAPLATSMGGILRTFSFLLGVLVNTAMFALIYRYLPSPAARVTWRQAWFGGGIVAILWEIVKQGFALYLNYFGGGDNYNRVYGSFAGLIILILWVYISATLLLIGAQIAELYGEWKEGKPLSHNSNRGGTVDENV
jgi:membrane protein